MGGTAASVPVAMTTARRAVSASSPTCTMRSPVIRPWPRTSAIPWASSHGVWLSSLRWLITSSRRSKTAWTSSAVDRLGGAADALRLGQHLAGAQERLGGHAAVEGALAADEVLLDDHDLEARIGQAPGTHLPGGTGTDHHDIAAALAHGAPVNPGATCVTRPWHPARMLRSALALALVAAALVAACGSDSNAENAATNTNATASTNDDTGSSSPAEGRAAAGRGVRLVKVGDFDSPLYVTAPPGDRRRIFVVEQAGRDRRRARRQDRRQAVPRHPLEGHRGRRAGPALDGLRPGLRAVGPFYVYYTDKTATETIWEYHRASADSADAGSARLVLRMDDPEPNHNGGLMVFGPDKLLYVGTGDGGGGNDQHGARGNAQSLSSLLGKILRIDPRASRRPAVLDPVRRTRSSGARAPAARSTPTACATRGASRSTAPTGDLVIGDVGQDEVEEIDFVKKGGGRGANFGWRPWEGRRRNFDEPAPGAVFPVITHTPPGGLLLDHGRLRRPRPRRAGAVRPLRVRRLLQLATCACDPAHRPRVEPHAVRARDLRRLLVRRGRRRARLRDVAQRPGLPLRGALTARHGAGAPRRVGRARDDAQRVEGRLEVARDVGARRAPPSASA